MEQLTPRSSSIFFFLQSRQEKATTAALVCRNVMDSYRMSLGDIGGALLRKVEFLNSLLAELN